MSQSLAAFSQLRSSIARAAGRFCASAVACAAAAVSPALADDLDDVIQDIDLAPRNADGRVEYSMLNVNGGKP